MQTKQDHAYQILKRRITEGSLLPGQRIVVNRMAQEIGTSAIPVREALLRLEAEGLVEITPHVGAVVTLVTGKRIEMTLETLAVMEGYATRLAADRADEILPDLQRSQVRMREAAERGDWETFSAANRRFHFAMYGVVDNKVLTKTIEDLWTQLDSYLSASAFYLMPDRALGSVEEHDRILAELAAAEVDLDVLEALARTHKFNTAKRLRATGSSDASGVSFSPASEDVPAP